MMPLTETIAVAGVKADGLDYGRMRLWGSLAFIGVGFLGGGADRCLRPCDHCLADPVGIGDHHAGSTMAAGHTEGETASQRNHTSTIKAIDG